MRRKADDPLYVNAKTLVVGIDIGKDRHVAVAVAREKAASKPLEFANSRSGFRALGRFMEEHRGRYGCDKVIVCYESSGHFWEPLAYWLKAQKCHLAWVNPLHTKLYREISDNSPLQSDAKDGRVIAELALQNKHLECLLPEDTMAQLRLLVASREHFKTQEGRIENRLRRLLDRTFPELVSLWGNFAAKSFCTLLSVAPFPSDVASLGEDRLTELLRTTSRGRHGRQRARAIVEAARDSIGVCEGLKGCRQEFQVQLELLKVVRTAIDGIEQRLERILEKIDYARALLDIKGIGVVTVATILGEAGDLRAYRSAKALTKMAGLNLFYTDSGTRDWGKRRIARRGRGRLRRILYLAALRLIRQGQCLKPYYDQVVKGCKETKMKAIVAVMRKLTRVIHAIARTGSRFDATKLLPVT